MFEEILITQGELNVILSKNESYILDFKSKRIEVSKLQNHFIAFANSDGGDLYVGVEELKAQGNLFRVDGFSNIEEANQMLYQLLQDTDPAIEGVVAEFLLSPSKEYILHIAIPKSDKVHYNAKGECYVRLNAQSIKIKGDKITRLAYAKGFYRFEDTAVESIDVCDIAESKYLHEYLNNVQSSQDPEKFLQRNRLIKNDKKSKPTVAAALLFDEQPQEVISTKCGVKIIRMQTTSKDYKRQQLSSVEVITGPIDIMAKDAEDKIFDIIKSSTFMINGGEVKVSYPVETVHEILVNAILHRDYSITDDIHVTIYDDRIEIKSPGRLPGNVTVDNILDAHFSRNPNIVRIINKLPNPINHDLGEGLNTAFKAMQSVGLVKPLMEEIDNNVIVVISHEKLKSYEEQIMAYLENNDWVSNKVARSITGEGSENKIKRTLQNLRKANRIEIQDANVARAKLRYVKKRT